MSPLRMYIKVKVTPGAKKESFVQSGEDTFVIAVKEKAERNLANNRVLTLLARHLNIPKAGLSIITGHHSPNKIIFYQS